MGPTTTIAVELLVIGYQAMIWIGLAACLFQKCDGALLASIREWKELTLILSVPAAYTVGAIMNGVASHLVSKLDRKWIFKRSIKPSAMRAAILIQNPQAFEHVIKNFNEPRVLRSTIFNIFLIGVFGIIHLYALSTFTYLQLGLIASLFLVASLLAAWAWYETTENFYVHLSQTYDALEKP